MDNNEKNCSKLEIDDSIITKQLLLEGNASEELTTLFPEPLPGDRATVIKPKPGLCVKTRDEDKNKVFVNVCTSEAIPGPEDITEKELLTILESDQPSDFRIPMSIGQPHQEKDKAGEDCVAYDIIINPAFFEKMSDNPLFNNFFMIVCIEGLEEKYKVSLDKNGWTILKNKKYHGTLPEQAIRTMVPLVQELSGVRKWKPENLSSTEESPVSNEPLIREITTKIKKSNPSKKQEPKYIIRKIANDEKLKQLEAEIELPDMVNGKDIDVNIGEDRIVIETPISFLDVFVPYELDAKNAKAFFIKSTRVLDVLIPLAG